jgi:hypothetical protein
MKTFVRCEGLAGIAFATCLHAVRLEAEAPKPFLNSVLSWVSTAARNESIELFTSEGCSSCPPADRWMQSLTRDRRLWKTLFPIGWHVDYWNDLGWVDPLSCREGTARQEAYIRHWGRGGAYTPEFVRSGREWRTWSISEALPEFAKPQDVGILGLSGRFQSGFTMSFKPVGGADGPWEARVVLMESGVSHEVSRGENAGRRLQHAFAVRTVASASMKPVGGGGAAWTATLRLPLPSTTGQEPSITGAVVGWVSRPGDPTPVQITGGPLLR